MTEMPAAHTQYFAKVTAAFARAMEEQLLANAHKSGWSGLTNGTIMARIQQELDELRAALASKDKTAIRHETADVANFLLFLLDNNTCLCPNDSQGGPGDGIFHAGEKVAKTTGDYTFDGEVVASFRKLSGARRYVVEDGRGLLFIFSEQQLSRRGP